MKLKIAIFKSTYGGIAALEEWAEDNDDYSRLTEFVEVVFPDLPDSEKINNELTSIEKIKDSLSDEFALKMNELNTRKEELLAIECKT